MKVAILKQLHKKYDWYFNKEKLPVLINHSSKKVIIYDYEYLTNRYNYSNEDFKQKVKVPLDVWALRVMLNDILNGRLTFQRQRYKLAVRNFNKRKQSKTA